MVTAGLRTGLLAALGRYDAVAADVLDTMRFLTGTLTTGAYLADVRSLAEWRALEAAVPA